MTGVGVVNCSIVITCIIGIGLSYYAYNVSSTKRNDQNYTPMCDISEHMSCSKVLLSKYAKGFGLVGELVGEGSVLNQPNSLGGMIFYTTLAILSALNTVTVAKIQFGLSIISNVTSIYLAYILYYILYDFCVVCVSTYVVNLINLVLTLIKLQMVKQSSTRGQSPSKKSKKTN